jgi:hypothetical protein
MAIALPDNIISLQDEDDNVNLLVYGDSGIGKTVFCGSDDDVLFIAPEDNGTLSAKRFGSTAKKWKIQSWTDIVAAYEWLYSLDEIPFNWVVLDSLTEMQQMCMRQILDEAHEQNPGRDPDVPQLQDWQPYFERFRRLVKAFNSLPVNVIYTALAQEENMETEDGDEYKRTLPMLQGKGTQFANQVASWMTSFGHMSVRRIKVGKNEDGPVFEDRRQIQWRGTKTVMAKDRTRCLEPKTVNMSLKEVRELLESGPKQPAAGRVTPPKSETPAKRRRRDAIAGVLASADGNHENPMTLVTVGGSDEDEGE